MNFYPILILMFTISIYSAVIPNALSIDNKNNSLSFYEEKCTDGLCTATTCYNHQPCSTSTGSNNTTNTTPRDNASQLFTNSLFS